MQVLRLPMTALWLSCSLGAMAAGIKIDFDGRDGNIGFTEPQVNGAGLRNAPTTWLPQETRNQYQIFSSGKLPQDFSPYSITLTPNKSGKVKLFIRGDFRSDKTKADWARYRQLAISGSELQNADLKTKAPSGIPLNWEGMSQNFAAAGEIKAAHDFGVVQWIPVTAGKPLTLTFQAADGGISEPPHRVANYSSSSARIAAREERPAAYYRYYDNRVKLLPLADKGIDGSTIKPREPGLKVRRSCPEANFSAGAAPRQPNTTRAVTIPIELQESAGTDRNAAVRCGVPFAKGEFFRMPGQLQLFTPDGKNIPCQISAVGFWPDGSVKWALLQFHADLKAGKSVTYTLENRPQNPLPAKDQLKITESTGEITITTGPLQAVIDKQKFNLLKSVAIDGNRNGKFEAAEKRGAFAPEGVKIRNEKGQVFAAANSAPEKITFEEKGPQVATLKVTGSYTDADGNEYGKYISRLRFHAGSDAVEIMHKHVNNHLDTEFTDFTDLTVDWQPAAKITGAALRLPNESLTLKPPFAAFQADEKKLTIGDADRWTPMTGAITIHSANGPRETITIRDAALRYPKGYRADAEKLTIQLLPQLPDAKFGTTLPHYLQFPFCEGFYRLKWGMGFTENIRLDFGDSAAKADAEANQPVIAVVNRDYLASTRAIPGVTPTADTSFADWDREVAKSVDEHYQRKLHYREFGFLNYGDWYGERERNWGNNEYDLAHGLFSHFARTGNRLAFKLAEAAAQHQADVDIVQAYPDRFYLGANAQHGIGHTGVNYQNYQRATWSYPCDISFSAQNGHTWSEGMLECWYHTGNPMVMDSALMLGEHMLNFMAPSFTALGTHERSAGWSLKALMALYRATGDPAYLKACEKIVGIALKEQKFDKGGAWPHPMPPDHANGHKNTYGNCPYLIGILLEGLREYHLDAGTPATAKSISAGAQWLKKVYNYNAMHWPYAVGWDGKIYSPGGNGLDCMISSSAMTGANLSNDRELRRISANSLQMASVRGLPADGKSFAIAMILAPGLMEELHIWGENHSGENFRTDRRTLINEILKNNTAPSFRLRAPEVKTFHVTLNGDNATILVDRQRHGSRPQCKPTGTVSLLSADDKVLATRSFDTKQEAALKFPVSGKAGDTFTVKVSDDMTGTWSIRPDKAYKAEAELVPGSTIGGGGPALYTFAVPAGTREFTVNVSGIHAGKFGATVIDQHGNIRGELAGTVHGEHRLPWLKYDRQSDPAKHLTIKLDPVPATNQVWQVYVWATGDMGLTLSGIPSRVRIDQFAK